MLVPCAGNTVPMASKTLELIACSHPHMVEVWATLLGMKTSVNRRTHKVVKSGVSSGIPNVHLAITTLHAVSAHQIARMGRSILEYHARNSHMAEQLEYHSHAKPQRNMTQASAMTPADQAMMELDQFAGKFAKLATMSVVHCV